ncbi:hypothetical protein BDM02DRAFT_3180749 [Thelephora ganbajun]|uniref:Uncharacterized protein n=1 Tax=Thelephora ganbajun TaxID=370292 RepID=A0ACB6ZBN0_THEGA|nr:hypothetical protein BDM02DRAFT_3180749 [Thelephora ganbajun]
MSVPFLCADLASSPDYPPNYAEWHKFEVALPQHNQSLPFPEGKEGRYVYFSEHVKTAGWGNVLQEHFFQALLAYLSRRSYTFDSFSGTSDGPPFRDEHGNVVPVNIPISAFLSGPLAGGSFPPGDLTPRAVRKSYFDEVCPNPKLLDKAAIRAKLPENYTALHLLAVWVRMMDEELARCVEIDERVFDIGVFGTWRIYDGLPVLLNNPITKLFSWSPLVEDAFKINQRLFTLSSKLPPPTPEFRYPPIPGLLALHVRRGDFEGHCPNLRRWKVSFTGLNTQPGTIDKDIDLVEKGNDSSTQASIDAFQRACYPDTNQIVERVRQIRMTEEGKGLRNIFIMTNGSPEWVEELKEALMKDYHWKQIASSLQMRVSWEQKFVAQAVDMMIAHRADVFIGNGFSSLTGSVFMVRIASGLAAGRQRLWL